MMKNMRFLTMVFLATACVFTSCSKHHSGNGNGNDNSWDGQLPYHTDFNNNVDEWPSGNIADSATATVENGYYTIVNTSTYASSFADAPYSFFGQTTSDDDISIKASVKIVSNNDAVPEGYGGFSFDYIDTGAYKGQFLIFGIYSDGYYDIKGFSSLEDETGTVYQQPTQSSAIKKDDFNTLQIKLSGGKFYFYINGTNVYSMNEPFDDNLDIVSFFADYYSTAQVDNFTAEVI